MNLCDQVKILIQKEFKDAKIIVLDPRNDGMHLEAVIVSDTFEGMPLLKRHQMVMDCVKDLFAGKLHALALKTYTKEEWSKEKTSEMEG